MSGKSDVFWGIVYAHVTHILNRDPKKNRNTYESEKANDVVYREGKNLKVALESTNGWDIASRFSVSFNYLAVVIS